MTAVWGVHNDTLGQQLIDDGFISIGWDKITDLSLIGDNRDALKAAQAAAYPETKPGAVPVQAGTLYRFAFQIAVRDVIIAPFRDDGTINIGVVTGPYYYDSRAEVHRHRRRVEWRKIGLARTTFSQPALYEIGAAISVFAVKRHAGEFLAVLGTEPAAPTDTVEAAASAAVEVPSDEPADEPRVGRVERFTRDFVLGRLGADTISHRDFEEFTAALFEALGYRTRVTPYSQDGGVDVIAHRDPLGIEPPLIKIQCKHRTATTGPGDVQQLIGTLGKNEVGVFVALGPYSRDAQSIERQRQDIRLINGEAIVDLVLQSYDELSERWRSHIPLARTFVVQDG